MRTDEAAQLLGVSPQTLRRWVRQGLLVTVDPRGERFERSELERWARARGLDLPEARGSLADPEEDLLAGAVERGAVSAGPRAASALEAIELAVGALPGLEPAARASLLEEVLERERMASTGLGRGVALPHPRKPPAALFARPVISALFPAEPLDWAAVDGKPVHTVLLVLSPSAATHLELLARIAVVLRLPETDAFLRSAPAKEQLVERLLAIKKDA